MLREWWHALPRLVRFMVANFTDGVVLGWQCGLLLIWFDIFDIQSLLEDENALLTALFFFQSGLMFGTFAMSVAVMNLDDDE